jgi:hypothetical protein
MLMPHSGLRSVRMTTIRRGASIVLALLGLWGTRDTVSFIRLIAGPDAIATRPIKPGLIVPIEIAVDVLLFVGAFSAWPRRATAN